MSGNIISENLSKVLNQIRDAEKSSGRKANSVKLCAVSKFHSADEVEQALKSSQILYGENRVQEAFEKFNLLKEKKYEPILHIIGSLQTNKVKKACMISSCIQSVDRLDLIVEIEKQCAKLEKSIDIFFEMHTAEDSKSGFSSTDEVLKICEKFALNEFPHVIPKGLMTMAPFTNDKKLISSSFIFLRNFKETLLKEFPNLPVEELSMGMSGDFETAIKEGSTMVRIGTAIFGERDYSK